MTSSPGPRGPLWRRILRAKPGRVLDKLEPVGHSCQMAMQIPTMPGLRGGDTYWGFTWGCDSQGGVVSLLRPSGHLPRPGVTLGYSLARCWGEGSSLDGGPLGPGFSHLCQPPGPRLPLEKEGPPTSVLKGTRALRPWRPNGVHLEFTLTASSMDCGCQSSTL